MKNLALKFAKEDGFVSAKIQELLDQTLYPDKEFEDEAAKKLYEEAKYYHKAQHGSIRMSKYVFSETADIKRKCLIKHNLEPVAVDYFYDYGMANTESSTQSKSKSWYVNSAADKAFREWGSNSFSQEAAMVQKMPLLHKASLFLDGNIKPTVRFRNENKVWLPSPLLFEGVPLWLSSYSGNVEYVSWEHRCNILAMMAPYGGNGKYTEGQISNLLLTLFAAFGGIVKRSQKDKCDYVELYTSSWGCGNFRNNKELIYLSQLYAADVMGVNKIIFHKIDENLLESAIQKYKALPDNLSFIEAVNSFIDFGFNWPT